MKLCTKCDTKKPPDDFFKSATKRDGRQSWCKVCAGKHDKARASQPARRAARAADQRARVAADPEKWRRYQRDRTLRTKYGITIEEYEARLAAQDGHCAICPRTPTDDAPLVVDHDHATGLVRGLLCHNCNSGIGMLGDDLATVRSAAWYLAQTQTEESR